MENRFLMCLTSLVMMMIMIIYTFFSLEGEMRFAERAIEKQREKETELLFFQSGRNSLWKWLRAEIERICRKFIKEIYTNMSDRGQSSVWVPPVRKQMKELDGTSMAVVPSVKGGCGSGGGRGSCIFSGPVKAFVLYLKIKRKAMEVLLLWFFFLFGCFVIFAGEWQLGFYFENLFWLPHKKTIQWTINNISSDIILTLEWGLFISEFWVKIGNHIYFFLRVLC